jgi:hypothetical protein
MKYKPVKWILISLAIIVLLLIFLNPSTAEFRNYARNIGDPKGTFYKRQANYLIFSFYSKEWQDKGWSLEQGSYTRDSSNQYLGIAGNFYGLKNN